ncbi:MAG: transglutaminase domain-containing protein [Acidobacteria bacterium]|nr:transglutaminase domain-containing protein [Acidobacteriota bacterium]
MQIYKLFLYLFLVVSLVGVTKLQASSEETLVSPIKQRKFEFTYSATVQIPEGSTSAKLWLPVPKSDINQQITNVQVKSEQPVSFLTDAEYGNSVLVATSNNPKAGTFTVEMAFQITRQENINRLALDGKTIQKTFTTLPDPLMPRWLQPDKLVPISQRIKDLATEITKDKLTDEEKLTAIYYYAANNLKYDKSGSGWGRGDIYFACDEKRGNCTDFHALIIGLCRAVGIPARFAIGFSVPNDKAEGQIAGYHCWAEGYIKGKGWIPMDASEASKNPQLKDYFFGAHDENRVEFSIGRDVALPGIHSEPLNFFIYPYAEIDQKPTDKVERKFAFKNL